MGYDPWFGWVIKGFGRNMFGKLMTRKFGKRYGDTSLWMGKKVKIFVLHVNVHQRVTSAEEDCNNQVDRMTCAMDTSQPFLPPIPVTVHWAYEQSGHAVRDRSYRWAQQHRLQLIKTYLGMTTAEYLICYCQRLTLNPWYDTTPWGNQKLPRGRLITLDCYHHGSSSCLFLLEKIHILNMVLHSSHEMFLPKLLFVDLQNALSTTMVFYTALLSDQGTHFTAKEMNSGLILMEFTGLIFPTILKQLAW